MESFSSDLFSLLEIKKMVLKKETICFVFFSFLVGNGALQWAQDHGIKGVSMSSLLTKNSLKAYRKHKRRLSDVEQGVAKTRNIEETNVSLYHLLHCISYIKYNCCFCLF